MSWHFTSLEYCHVYFCLLSVVIPGYSVAKIVPPRLTTVALCLSNLTQLRLFDVPIKITHFQLSLHCINYLFYKDHLMFLSQVSRMPYSKGSPGYCWSCSSSRPSSYELFDDHLVKLCILIIDPRVNGCWRFFLFLYTPLPLDSPASIYQLY